MSKNESTPKEFYDAHKEAASRLPELPGEVIDSAISVEGLRRAHLGLRHDSRKGQKATAAFHKAYGNHEALLAEHSLSVPAPGVRVPGRDSLIHYAHVTKSAEDYYQKNQAQYIAEALEDAARDSVPINLGKR